MDQTIPPIAFQKAVAGADLRNDGADTLITLHQRTVDVLTGYAKMVEKAEPSFRSIAEEFRALHARQADRLARMIADMGHAPDPDGTLMGTVNKAVISLRALFDDIDDDVMDSVRDGEKHVLELFDDAMGSITDAAVVRDLGEMRAEIVSLVDRMAHLD